VQVPHTDFGGAWHDPTPGKVAQARTAELLIATEPPDADITVDAVGKGRSPVFLEGMKEGDAKTITARRGTMAAHQEIRLEAGLNEVLLTLEQEIGNLFIQTVEKEAEVYLDGTLVGRVGNGLLRGMAAGGHEVELRLPLKRAMQHVEIPKDATARMVPEFEMVFSIPMTVVEGGTFRMGSTEHSDEKPVHSVTVDSFSMGTYLITQDVYQQVTGGNPSNWKGGRLPVEQVSWFDAVEFCNALSRKDGLEEVYTIKGETVTCDWDKRGYRLPTEAEWEYAARGGKLSRGYTYAGSNTAGDVVWYDGNSKKETHEVGTKQANELGLYDMSGNVWEWCWDWYDREYYGTSPATNPHGPQTGSRGAGYVRVAGRLSDVPSDRLIDRGFRVVFPGV
jgi:formylglycine-generating enzyme required for sulfatase activity